MLWSHISLLQALEKKPTARPTAEQLLQHPWLRQHAPKKAPESTSMKQAEPMQIDTVSKVRCLVWRVLSLQLACLGQQAVCNAGVTGQPGVTEAC